MGRVWSIIVSFECFITFTHLFMLSLYTFVFIFKLTKMFVNNKSNFTVVFMCDDLHKYKCGVFLHNYPGSCIFP